MLHLIKNKIKDKKDDQNMYNTLTFSEMNTFQKLEWLSDILGDACFSVDTCIFQDMDSKQKDEVQKIFFSFLQNEKAEITTELIDKVKQNFPSSPLTSLLRIYKYSIQSIFSNVVQELSQGRKVTIIKFSEFGFPIVFNTVINHVKVESWAQYKETLNIIHKPKRKRSLYSNRILPDNELIVYDGWLNIDVDALTSDTIKQNDHITVKQSRYGCFDDNYLTDVINSINQKPIVKLNVK
jgi:hypothetical protein